MSTPLRSRERAWTSRWELLAIATAAALATAVQVTAVRTPLLLDDYAQRAIVDGAVTPHRSAWDLYDFIDDGDRASLLNQGAIPWWCSPRLTIRFFRPVASWLAWLDVSLFGAGPLGAHLHSLLWWIAAVVAVLGLLRSVLEPQAAWIGTFLFALCPCHAPPLEWPANREVLVSIAFGACGLRTYLRWRERAAVRDALICAAAFFLALGAGEYALCFAGYVLAIEAARSDEPVFRRLLKTSPFAIPATIFIAIVCVGGYGARGSGFYRSPLGDFARFVSDAPRRAASLLATAWLGLDEGSWAGGWGTLAPACLATALIVFFVAGIVRSIDGRDRAATAWLLPGSIFAILPLLAAQPSWRLLGVPMLGVSGALGAAVSPRLLVRSPIGREGGLALAALIVYTHAIHGIRETLRANREAIAAASTFSRDLQTLEARLNGPSGTSPATVVVVGASTPPSVLWAPYMLSPRPRWRVLSFQAGPVRLVRTAANAVELTSEAAPLFPCGPNDLFREAGGLRAGEVFAIAGMRATVERIDGEGAPRAVSFDFDVDLNDPSVLVVTEDGHGFRPLRLPQVGLGIVAEGR